MLKINHLKKQYGRFSLGCSMEVRPGCITGLIGQNGAGKSTAFKAVLGLIYPDSGEITLLGKNRRDFSARDQENLGVVLSDSGFSGYLTVRDVMKILKHMYRSFDQGFFMERAERFQLPLDKKIKEFSTGMKAKLKVLAAVSHDARLLILDEPTAGLDVVAREELLDLLREFMERDEKRSILISSHISQDLEHLCDDLYLIHEGNILLHEETDALLSEYALLKLDQEQYRKIEKQYLLRIRRESYGFSCLTNQKQFYLENYPGITVEKGTIDEVVTMMVKGEKV